MAFPLKLASRRMAREGADFEVYLDGEQISSIENGELEEEGLEGWLENGSE